ncbi:MAG: addiction module toxin RelE [Candidatus Binatia bacterium]
MARAKPAFEIAYMPETVRHLDAIQAKYLRVIRKTIEEQLSHEPFNETTNRKPLLRQSPFGENVWEIRFAAQNRLRVFYGSDPDVPRRVLVEAIGTKNRNRLMIGGQEVKYEN